MILSFTNFSYYYFILLRVKTGGCGQGSASDQLHVAIGPFVVLDLNLKNLNALQKVDGVQLHSPFHSSPHHSPLFQTPLLPTVTNPAWS